MRWTRLGNCYEKEGDWSNARTNYDEALKLYENEPPDIGIPQRRECLNAKARVLRSEGLTQQATDMEEKAKHLDEQ